MKIVGQNFTPINGSGFLFGLRIVLGLRSKLGLHQFCNFPISDALLFRENCIVRRSARCKIRGLGIGKRRSMHYSAVQNQFSNNGGRCANPECREIRDFSFGEGGQGEVRQLFITWRETLGLGHMPFG